MSPDGDRESEEQLEFWDEAVLPRPAVVARTPTVEDVLRERERQIADARAAATRLREQAEELVVSAREAAARIRSDAERERDAVVATALSLAEEWLLEADDEWGAIVDRAVVAAEAAAVERADQVRDRIVAAAEREASDIVEAGRVARQREIDEAERDRQRILAAAKREHDQIIEDARRAEQRMQEDADARIEAERDVIVAAAEDHARRVLADAHVKAKRIETDAEVAASTRLERIESERTPADVQLRAVRDDLEELLAWSQRMVETSEAVASAVVVATPALRVVPDATVRVLPVEREPLIGSGRRDRSPGEVEVDDNRDDHAEPSLGRRVLARLFGR